MEKAKNIRRIETQEIQTAVDKKLVITVVFLLVIGFMSVFSASLPMCMTNGMWPFYYVVQHLMCLAFGVWGLYGLSKLDYNRLKPYAIPFAIFVIFLLLLVQFSPLGVTLGGATRWLNLGFIKFQPSELTKISIIMLMANVLSLNFSKSRRLYERTEISSYIYPLVYTGIILVMIFVALKQPNLSMALILSGIALCMYICSGKTLKFVGIAFVIAILGIGLIKADVIDLTKVLEPHQIERIKNFLNGNTDVQGGGYQVFHSMIALASGGIVGQGYGASKEKLGWLPEAHTDFIFAVVGEETGFLGSLCIIALYWMLFYRGMFIAFKSPNLYGRLMAFGITISITMQAFFNISVASSFLPATGITLPFISYGGSSLMVSLCMIGILLNISKTQVKRIYQKNKVGNYAEN